MSSVTTIRANDTVVTYAAPLDVESDARLTQAIAWSHTNFRLKPAPGTVFRRALALYASHLDGLQEHLRAAELRALQAAGKGRP